MKNLLLLTAATFVVAAAWMIFDHVKHDNSKQSPELASQVSQAAKVTQPVASSGDVQISEKAGQDAGSTIIENEENTAIAVVTLENWKPDIYLPPRFIQSDAKLTNNPNDPEQLPEEAIALTKIDQPEQTAIQSLHILLSILRGFSNQGDFPTGDNIEVTNALLGKNYRKVAYLPQSHPRINEVGEITDQWGTAYSFHFESSHHVTIRSAGPDHILYNEDDIVGDMQ